jgi:hypothetical protein
MAFNNQQQQPYTLHVSCQKSHLGYIIGFHGKVIKSLIQKWNGKIHNIFVNDPAPQLGRPSHHITIIGEEKAVHLLALEINEMIKVSMGRTETKLKCGINDADQKLQKQQTTNLRIAFLEEELRELKEENERLRIESEWGTSKTVDWVDSENRQSSDESDSESESEDEE